MTFELGKLLDFENINNSVKFESISTLISASNGASDWEKNWYEFSYPTPNQKLITSYK